MNYYIRSLCLTFICGLSASGLAQPITVEGKAGVFIPTSNKMREIFDTALPFVEVEGSYQFAIDWNAWAGVGYIFAKGESIGCGSTTTIDVIPFTLGVKRFFPLTHRLEGYLGVGCLWTLYRNQDHSEAVHQNISANDFGAILTTGLQYQLNHKFFVSLYAEYMFQRFDFSKVYPEHFTYRHDVDMSGTKIGLGITRVF